MNLREIIDICFQEYIANGYKANWEVETHGIYRHQNIRIYHIIQAIFDLAELGLVITELSESMESLRDLDYGKLGEELADIIIRILNFAERKNLNIEEAIILKTEKNLRRKKLHGRNI